MYVIAPASVQGNPLISECEIFTSALIQLLHPGLISLASLNYMPEFTITTNEKSSQDPI